MRQRLAIFLACTFLLIGSTARTVVESVEYRTPLTMPRDHGAADLEVLSGAVPDARWAIAILLGCAGAAVSYGTRWINRARPEQRR